MILAALLKPFINFLLFLMGLTVGAALTVWLKTRI